MQISVQRILHWGIPIFILGLIAWLCFFQITDTDFWWHIKAGQLMRKTGEIIRLDPFAYTRSGQPYLAIHEWLSQITLSSVFDLSGATGIILFRALLVTATFGLLLFIDPRRAWVNAILLGFSAASIRHLIADRPQLFTYILFAIFVVLCIRYLQQESVRRRKRILLFLPVITLLWSNFHGAAAVVGVALLGCVLFQRLVEYIFLPEQRSFMHTHECAWLGITLALCVLALLATPAGLHNISYLLSLQSDQATSFIAEWQPAPFMAYMQRTWFLWIMALASLGFVRKDFFFSATVLLGLGFLSRTAIRHEPLFILAALGIIFHQLRASINWHAFLDLFLSQKLLSAFCILGLLNLNALDIYRTSYDANREFQSYGFGAFVPASGAIAFIEEQNITGPIFNNYNVGGYLLSRDVPVFLDGRNIDYGFAYINRAIEAGVDPVQWNQLEEEYGFTHAIIYYRLQANQSPLPYTDQLDSDPDWALVYVDDWTAVYLKRTPENQSSIDQFAYNIITPKTLISHVVPDEITLGTLQQMEAELLRIITNHPKGIQAHLYLAQLSIMLQQYSPAEALLEEAQKRQPYNYQVYALLTTLSMEQEDWNQAEVYVDQAIDAAGYTHAEIDADFVRMVRENASE